MFRKLLALCLTSLFVPLGAYAQSSGNLTDDIKNYEAGIRAQLHANGIETPSRAADCQVLEMQARQGPNNSPAYRAWLNCLNGQSTSYSSNYTPIPPPASELPQAYGPPQATICSTQYGACPMGAQAPVGVNCGCAIPGTYQYAPGVTQ